jgi:hypothetical protein
VEAAPPVERQVQLVVLVQSQAYHYLLVEEELEDMFRQQLRLEEQLLEEQLIQLEVLVLLDQVLVPAVLVQVGLVVLELLVQEDLVVLEEQVRLLQLQIALQEILVRLRVGAVVVLQLLKLAVSLILHKEVLAAAGEHI